ncbi:hypothetical protein MCUN1_002517 [Malassezia cuniculi]|uniref:Dopey N-terminal domain-containing protein n=1 Tax=Malassezia cuniculi TaxID=948313 RepID=A0AAF0EW48_9BASI|nr:hypothetical protein MCUN1_002517 [Malassezia cuniculi]
MSDGARVPPWDSDALVARSTAAVGTSTDESSIWRTTEAKRAETQWARQSERALQNNPAFRKQQANVERTLARFESVSEWADFIAFLGRLLKVLQADRQFNVIPHKLIVAKRLSQCLNPALPSGVHTRAIEVYVHIFETIGSEGLRRDLQVWSPGLLPFFAHAATSVRPSLLALYDRFYVPLSVDLRPLTRALLLALLPGLEEENGEFFDRVVRLLDHISNSVGASFFLSSVWMVLISSPGVRLSALHYLARRMPPLNAENCAALLAPDPGLMVRGIVHTLDDELLVRRNALDFVVSHLALSSHVVRSALTDDDRVLLTDAVLGCVLRRDLSLNRRVYSWLLGPDGTEDYFEEHALKLVTAALRQGMDEHADRTLAQRPYKIFMSLLDKQTVGAPLVNALALEAFAKLTHADAGLEMHTTAQMLFDSIDSEELYRLVYLALCRDGPINAVELFSRMLDVCDNNSDDAQVVHLPALLLAVLDRKDALSRETIELVARLCGKLSPQAFLPLTNEPVPPLGDPAAGLYSDKKVSPPLQNRATALALIERLVKLALDSDSRVAIRAVSAVVADLDAVQDDTYAELVSKDAWAAGTINLCQFDDALFTALGQGQFATFDALLHMALAVSSSPLIPGEFALAERTHLCMLVHRLIEFLHPESPVVHPAVDLFWKLKLHVRHDLITPILCDALSTHDSRKRRAALDAFGSLWRLSKDTAPLHVPVLLVLDRLRSPDLVAKHEGVQWLREVVSSYKPLMRMLVERATNNDARRRQVTTAVENMTLEVFEYECPFEQDQLNYSLATISALLATGGKRILASVKDEHMAVPDIDEGVVVDVLRDYLIVLLRSEPSAALVEAMGDANAITHAYCLEIFHIILATLEPPLEWYVPIEKALVDVLLHSINGDTRRQELILITLLQVLSSRVHAAAAESLDDDGCALVADLVRRGIIHAKDIGSLTAWADFATGLLPLVDGALVEYLVPVLTTLSELICHGVTQLAQDNGDDIDQIKNTFAPKVYVTGSANSETALLRLIGVADNTLRHALAVQGAADLHRATTMPETQVSSSILGNLSSVLVASEAPTPPSSPQWPAQLSRACAFFVQSLQYAWLASSHAPALQAGVFASLERLYHSHTAIVMDSVVHTWVRAEDREVADIHSFDTVNALGSSAQIICTFIADTISSRANGRKGERAMLESADSLFAFLNAYVFQLDADTVAHIWPVLVLLIRGVISTHSTSRTLVVAAFHLVTMSGSRVLETQSAEDRRVRRDIHECFSKLFELTLALYGRVDMAAVRKDEKSGPETTAAVVKYIAEHALPTLAKLRIESDKATAICATVTANIVAPEFRAKGKSVDVDPLVLDILVSMSGVPDTHKAWRSIVSDAFMEPKFFALSTDTARVWAKIITPWLAGDRERLLELIGRITSNTGNIFASREADNIARTLNIRRISFVLFSAANDSYLTHLPQMQEKLVETLRSSPADIVQAEVYLCMRVLLCRFKSQHLSGFWPIILAELLRIFGDVREQLPQDKTDAVRLLGSVSKLADFLITLQTEDFQIHQWLLITDTSDSIYPLPEWESDSLLDCIAKAMEKLDAQTETVESGALRCPLIQDSHIESVRALKHFFANASSNFYKNEYSSARLDWEYMNTCLLRDIFDPDRVADK